MIRHRYKSLHKSLKNRAANFLYQHFFLWFYFLVWIKILNCLFGTLAEKGHDCPYKYDWYLFICFFILLYECCTRKSKLLDSVLVFSRIFLVGIKIFNSVYKLFFTALIFISLKWIFSYSFSSCLKVSFNILICSSEKIPFTPSRLIFTCITPQ